MFRKDIDELEKIMEEKEIAPEIQRAIIGSMKDVWSGNYPHPFAFGHAHFGRGLFLQSILTDQADMGWINFFSGRWSVKWKEAQKSHYRNNKKKMSARSLAITIL